MSRNSTTTRLGTLGLAFGLLLTIGIFGLGGCSDNALTTTTNNEFIEEEAQDNLIEADILRDCYEYETFAKPKKDKTGKEKDAVAMPPYLQASGSAKYSAKGFRIALDFGHEGLQVVFEFPKTALDKENRRLLKDAGRQITIAGEAVYCNGSYAFFYDCKPHGLEFNKPVILKQNVLERDLVPMGLFYKVDSSLYLLEEVSYVTNGYVLFHIWHFSKYGVSR